MNSKQKALIFITTGLALLLAFLLYKFQAPQTIELKTSEIPLAPQVELDASSLAVIARVQEMESLLKEKLVTEDKVLINNAVLSFLRQQRYGYRASAVDRFVWDQFGGSLLEECGIDIDQESVAQEYEAISKLGTALSAFNDPLSGNAIDFEHMAAVIDLNYTQSESSTIEERYYDALFSWGGDLETFLINMNKQVDQTGDCSYEALYKFARENVCQNETTYFGSADYYADFDGLQVALIMQSDEVLLSEALLAYYKGGRVIERNKLFIEVCGGEDAFKAFVLAVAKQTPEPQYAEHASYLDFLNTFEGVKTLMVEMVGGKPIKADESMRLALANAFIDFVKQGAQ